MTDDEILEIVMSHKEGKKIEYRELYLREHGRWMSADITDLWDFRNRRYRVAPEPRKPREWWVHISTDGKIESILSGVLMQDECVRVREVVENE